LKRPRAIQQSDEGKDDSDQHSQSSTNEVEAGAASDDGLPASESDSDETFVFENIFEDIVEQAGPTVLDDNAGDDPAWGFKDGDSTETNQMAIFT
jgi:hypothetical protein